MDVNEWGYFLFDAATWTLASIAIYEGARRLAAGQRQRSVIVIFAAGLACVVLRGGGGLWGALEVTEPLAAAHRGGPEFPAQEREKSSRAYAAHVFTSGGYLITYVDQSGERKPFVPSHA
jgi:hypothetical protein